MRSFTQAKDDS